MNERKSQIRKRGNLNGEKDCLHLADRHTALYVAYSSFATDGANGIATADMDVGVTDPIGGAEREAYKQTLEEIWIDERGSIWVDGSSKMRRPAGAWEEGISDHNRKRPEHAVRPWRAHGIL